MLKLFHLQSPAPCKLTDLFHIGGNHDNVQIEADHRLDVGVDGQAADNAVGSLALLQNVQQCLENVILPMSNGLHEFLGGHRLP